MFAVYDERGVWCHNESMMFWSWQTPDLTKYGDLVMEVRGLRNYTHMIVLHCSAFANRTHFARCQDDFGAQV